MLLDPRDYGLDHHGSEDKDHPEYAKWDGMHDGSHMGEAGHRVAADLLIELARTAIADVICDLTDIGRLAELSNAAGSQTLQTELSDVVKQLPEDDMRSLMSGAAEGRALTGGQTRVLERYAAALKKSLEHDPQQRLHIQDVPMQRLTFMAQPRALKNVKEAQEEAKLQQVVAPSDLKDTRGILKTLRGLYARRTPRCWSVLSQKKTLQPVSGTSAGWLLEKPKLPWYVTLKYEDGPPGLPRAWSSNITNSTIEFDIESQGLGIINLWYLSSPWRKGWLERAPDVKEQLGTIDCHLSALSSKLAVTQEVHRFNASDARDEYSQGRDGGTSAFGGLVPGEKYRVTCVLVEGRFMLFAIFTE
jgi:hypothetical protein